MKSFTPSVPTCFWCLKPKPLRLVTPWYSPAHDYLPCPDCDAFQRRGVFVIEVANQPCVAGQPCLHPTKPGMFPTGRWVVLQRAAALFMGLPAEVVEQQEMTTTVAGFEEILCKAEVQKRATSLSAFRNLLPLPETMT